MDSDSPNALGDDGAAPPDRQDDAAADQADQAQQAEQAEPSPRTPDSYAKPELDQLYREGGLTDPELVERRERLTQSETDRATNDRRVLAQLQVQESRQAQQLAEAEATFATNLEENLSRMRSGADEASVRELVARDIAKYQDQARAIHTAPIERSATDVFLQVYGDTPANRQTVADLTLGQKTERLYRAGWDARDAQLAAETARVEAAAKKAADDVKAAQAPPDNPDTSGTKGRAGKPLTLEQIQNMSTSEWLSQGDHESRTQLLEDAHIRAARRGRP